MSAGKSVHTRKGGTAGPTPVVRPEAGAQSVPQEASSPNRRDKLINQHATAPKTGPVGDVHELT